MSRSAAAIVANLLAWVGALLLSWLIYAQFDTQVGRAGIYAAAVTAAAMLQILFWSQEGELLSGLELKTSAGMLLATIMLISAKGLVDLWLAGFSAPTVANIQAALDISARFGMVLTVILAVVFVTGFALTTFRLLLRRAFRLDS